MAQIQDHRHIICLINGHRVQGWADEDVPVEFPKDELNNITRGRDGSLYGTDTGNVGGRVTFRVAPTSPSAHWFIKQWEKRVRGERIIYEGSYGDTEQGNSVSFAGGILVQAPPMIEPGQTYEAILEFEEIHSDIDGAQSSAPPVLQNG